MVLQAVPCHECIILKFFRITPVNELFFQDSPVHVHAQEQFAPYGPLLQEAETMGHIRLDMD